MADQLNNTPESLALLRHTVSTLAYRSAKALRDVPAGFADFRAGEGTRTPLQILAHMGDLLDWALSVAQGAPNWSPEEPLSWEGECARYFSKLEALDGFMASAEQLGRRPEKIFQAPIADALAHTGQLTLLRRLAGAPIRGENYYVAPIQLGRVGADQEKPKAEF